MFTKTDFDNFAICSQGHHSEWCREFSNLTSFYLFYLFHLFIYLLFYGKIILYFDTVTSTSESASEGTLYLYSEKNLTSLTPNLILS
jgi:hypothetical protein